MNRYKREYVENIYKPRVHRGIPIFRADRNSSGIRWTARMENGDRLRADTLSGIKQQITDFLKV